MVIERRLQMKKLFLATLVGLTALSGGCDNDQGAQSSGSSGAATSGSSAAPAATQSTAAAPTAGEHKRIPIGEKTVGNLKLVATMDEPVKPGGEGAFDLVITGGKPKAVRFWVGTEDAKGSVKAKAEEETADNWHTHAEVPDPLPPGSKFWAEVEPPAGEKFNVSFDLKTQ
jgi:hypothetical protein